MTWQARVAEFHRATDQNDTLATPEARELRAKLIMEEAVETVAALGFRAHATVGYDKCWGDLCKEHDHDPDDRYIQVVAGFDKTHPTYNHFEFIDGLCDLIYVVLGGAENAGIDLDPHFHEVHRANMAKLSGPKRADGKQLKPEGWTPPDHAAVAEDSNYAPSTLGNPDGWGTPTTVGLGDWDR